MKYPTLNSLYESQDGKVSDKWALYLREYDALLSSYQPVSVRLLEIGIQNGGSLEKWTKFFPHATSLIGCDINPDCGNLTYEDSRVSVVVGDANSPETQHKILEICPEFEIVIDDGSHRSSDIVNTFARYFSCISDGGVFIAEDLHCSYWRNYEGGLFDPLSSMAFFKRLADIVSHEHWGVSAERRAILTSFSNVYGENFDEAVLAHIHSVEFINSICVVRKRLPTENTLGWRVVAGTSEQVFKGLKPLHLAPHVRVDESANPWSDFTHLPEDVASSLKLAMEKLEVDLGRAQQDINDAEARARAAMETASAMEARLVDSTRALQAVKFASERQHAQMLQSTSWRVTAPLRWLGSKIGKSPFQKKSI